MPDWSYQTLFRPLLFRLSPTAARDLALACLGTLSNLPLGPAVIDFMGHMRPDVRLAHTVGGLTFATRVGLGACLDPQLVAARAFSRFGIAFLEVGPLLPDAVQGGTIERDDEAESLVFHSPRETPTLETVLKGLGRAPNVPVFVRLKKGDNLDQFESDSLTVIDQLGSLAAGYILEIDNTSICMEALQRIGQHARTHRRSVVLINVGMSTSGVEMSVIEALTARGVIDGVFVDGRASDAIGRYHAGKPAFAATEQAVGTWRKSLGTDAMIISAGGVHEPVDALKLIDAGSDLVCVDSGLVFSGPGLVKRANELILFRQPPSRPIELRP
ncbi:MAG: hypothetical protein JWM11_3127, partial [Planctomycetaceae bacterium]|nr:hypothetical protein [Planctomycetaceae bacterium]